MLIKIFRLALLYVLIFFLRPSLACGCGDKITKIDLIILFGTLLMIFIVYLLPIIYYLMKFKKLKLSLWHMVIPNLMVVGMLFSFIMGHNLGLASLYYSVENYISSYVIWSIFIFVGVGCWSYPIVFMVLKSRLLKK